MPNDDGSGWAISKCTRETPADNGRLHESSTRKRPCSGLTYREGTGGQWSPSKQELAGDHGKNRNLRKTESPVPLVLNVILIIMKTKIKINVLCLPFASGRV